MVKNTMCLALFSYKSTPGYKLIFAANRDEFFARPTAQLSFWDDHENVLAGRDLQDGGTWLGVTQSGKIAALTNYREPFQSDISVVSRGEIVTSYLTGKLDSIGYLELLRQKDTRYKGYNLLMGDAEQMLYYSNRSGEAVELQPGIYGLSNHLLDSGWPKVVRGKQLLSEAVTGGDFHVDDIFTMLRDTHQPEDEDLPDTGVGEVWERILAPLFISSPGYGTRSSAVITVSDNKSIVFHEKTYVHDNGDVQTAGEKCFTV